MGLKGKTELLLIKKPQTMNNTSKDLNYIRPYTLYRIESLLQ